MRKRRREGKRGAKLCQNGSTRGRARGRWILFDCSKAPLGKQKRCWNRFVEFRPCNKYGTQRQRTSPTLSHLEIWKYRHEWKSTTPPLSAIWHLVIFAEGITNRQWQVVDNMEENEQGPEMLRRKDLLKLWAFSVLPGQPSQLALEDVPYHWGGVSGVNQCPPHSALSGVGLFIGCSCISCHGRKIS